MIPDVAIGAIWIIVMAVSVIAGTVMNIYYGKKEKENDELERFSRTIIDYCKEERTED